MDLSSSGQEGVDAVLFHQVHTHIHPDDFPESKLS